MVIGAAEQVRDRQKWAATRRDRKADELVQVQRHGSVFAGPEFVPTPAVSLTDIADDVVDHVAPDFVPELAGIDDLQVAATTEA